MAIVEYEEYKGNAMIVLRNDESDRYPFKFGLSKAKKIVENFDDIKKWVDDQESAKPTEE
jgi:hypothetical protein